MRPWGWIVAALGLGAVVACGLSYSNNTNTLVGPSIPTNATATPAGATPAPTQGGCLAPQVRVGPFGFDCPSGVTPPANTAGKLPMDCVGIFTATPKDTNGTDIPATVHGPNIAWAVTVGNDRVTLSDYSGEPFNKLVNPKATGEFTVTATVCGTTGSYSGTVVQ